MKKFLFEYTIGNKRGFVNAVSVIQAKDLAKVDYLNRMGFPVSHPKFRYQKSLINEVEVSMSESAINLLKKLYRYFQQGVIDATEMQDLNQLREIANNIKS